jgi:Zn-dependent protease with chaperone function
MRACSGYSKLNEYLADYNSMALFGKDAFLSGFRKYIENDIGFSLILNRIASDLVNHLNRSRPENPYERLRNSNFDKAVFTNEWKKTADRKEDKYDSHPNYDNRVEFANLTDFNTPPLPGSPDIYRDLRDYEAVEKKMLDLLYQTVKDYLYL